jgi:non-specific serine/threonine protein kinase
MAALSVSEPDSATAVVKQLIRRSIVHRRRIEGGVRYELLPALREFGEERLQNPPEVQRHFVTCMIQRLHDAEDNWFSGRQAETLRRLRGDIPNIRRAVKTAAALGDTDRAVEVVVTGWRQAFQIHGSEDELANWVAMALQTGTPSPRWAALGHALRTAIFSRSGKPGLATIELEQAAAARDILLSGDDSDTARTCDAAVRSAAETLERDDGEAAILLRSLLDELGEDAYRFGPMNIPQRLAARLYALGETEAADAVGSAIVERAVAVGDRFERSYLLTTRATAAAAVGDYETTEGAAREALVLKRGLGNGLGVAQALELLADVARERSDPVRSAHLLGAAAARWREAGALRGNYPPYFYDRDRTERAVRHRLGDPAFDRAFGYGAALSEGESIEFALHRIVEAHGRAGVPSVPGGSPLTPREIQVATLVADGASNKEMARRLFVSIRTIETHVQNALVKLGLRSRTGLALWYREHATRR